MPETSSLLFESVAAFTAALLGLCFAAVDAAINAVPEARVRALLEAAHPSSGRRRTSVPAPGRVSPVPSDGSRDSAEFDDEASDPQLRRLLHDRELLLGRLLVGRVVSLVAASVLATHVGMQGVPNNGAWWAFGVVTVVYTTIAEVVTALVRKTASDLVSPMLALVRPLELLVAPLAMPLLAMGKRIRAFGPNLEVVENREETARIAEAEVAHLIEKGSQTGALGDVSFLQAAVEFRGVQASQVMVPRTKMVALSVNTALSRVLELVAAEGHSRYPVYSGRVDEIIGLLYVKDLFRVVREGRLHRETLRSLVRETVLHVQETQEVSAILKEMRHRRLHMAIVLDEFGGTSGLLTLEDILEQLVGDIGEELRDEDRWEDLGEGRWLVDAATSVDVVEERLGVVLPESEHVASIGGLVMEQLGRVPPVGTQTRIGPLELRVHEADVRRVRKVEVRRALTSDRPARDEAAEE
ncbi:MAG: hemolysin family protein, partial [Polyangiales bacterium]